MIDPQLWTPFAPETAVSRALRRRVQSDVNARGRFYDLSEQSENVPEWPTDNWLDGSAFWATGRALSRRDRERLRGRCQVEAASRQYGVSVSYASIRAWPDDKAVFSDPAARIVERGQLSTLHTGEPIRILGQSADGSWYLMRCRTYEGWVRQDSVGVCEREKFELFATAAEYLVVVGRGAWVEPDPCGHGQPASLEFGAWIPLDDPQRDPWAAQYRVLIPQRGPEGQLVIRRGQVPVSAAVRAGFLPFTPHSVITSAFQLLGDRYGWGGRMDRRDCSGFVMDVYRTLGLQLPRDAADQENALPERVMAEGDKLQHAGAGDLLPMPGHIMMYLGRHGGHDFVVHAFVGFSETAESAPILPNQVMVTPLDIYLRRGGKTYLDAVTSIRRVF